MSTTPGSTAPTGNQGASTTEQAKAKAQETAQQAAGQARGRLRDQVDQRSTQAGQQVQGTAEDVRTIAQQLREQGKDQPAKLAEQAADRAQRLGNYLQDSDADRILHDVEDFGRRQPWAVMLGGLAAGFAASRFLKASSSRRSEERYAAGRPTTPPTGAADLRTRPAYVPETAPPITTAPPATPAGTVPPPAPPVGTTPPQAPVPPEPAPSAPARDVSLTGGVQHPNRPGGAV